MISRRRLATLVLVPTALFLIEASCNRVPLLAPSGSSITLTSATSVLAINGTATITAQVIEAAGTPPQAGTHVTFTTSLGTVDPAEATTNSAGQATATFTSPSSGAATITAISGGAAVPAASALKILVGTAAVQKVVVNASPATIPSVGGSSTVSAVVFDVNGNLMVGVPVTFSTTAGTLSLGVATTDAAGTAKSVITTSVAATVTAGVGVGASTAPTTGTPTTGTPTTPTTPAASGTASGSATISISAAPTLVITPPTTVPSAGLPASFTFAVTVAATNGSAVQAFTVNWGDGSAQELGSVTGSAIVAHVFKDAGNYLVKASVTDAAGNTVSVSSAVTVITAASPTIIITPTLPSTCTGSANVSLQLQVTVPTGIGVSSVSVDFLGDGSSVSNLGGLNGTTTLTKSYACLTNPTVKVTVVDTLGRTTTGQTSFKMP